MSTTETPPVSTISEDDLAPLTADPRKRELYRVDTYLREGLLSFDRLGAFVNLPDRTFVVIKPDAIAGRRSEVILDILRSRGWHPAAATTFTFSPLLTRELWRYQFNAASEQRIAVVDHLLGSGRSLLVLLEDHARPNWLPASARLTSAKGVADPEAAQGGDLRTQMGRVNGLFNFMHTADDPADVVRELQLFSYETGWSWCAEALARKGLMSTEQQSAASADVHRLIGTLEAETPAHDLDAERSLERLRHLSDAWAHCATASRSTRQIGDWLDTLATTPLPEGSARWDVLSVLTMWIDCNQPGIAAVLPTTSADDWRQTSRPT